MNIKEIYNSNKNVRDSDIPDEYKESFMQFMFGQTCMFEDGEFVYYSHDFRRWYHMNQKVINRNDKIDNIIK